MSTTDDSNIPLSLIRKYTGHRTCTHSDGTDTCERKHFSGGLCQAHYMRKWRYGDPGPVNIQRGPKQKLTDQQVVKAKSFIEKGIWSRRDAADELGVAYSTICEALRGKTFKHLNDSGPEEADSSPSGERDSGGDPGHRGWGQ